MIEATEQITFEHGTSPPWEGGMNPEQLEAVRHGDGPLQLLAVAGAGKTRAVVNRIARLVYAAGVPGERILAVTFSKKAADEMNHRLAGLGVTSARVGTWHSLCLQILKEDGTRYANWRIDDANKAKGILKDVLGYRNLNWSKSDLGLVTSFIGLCKANLFDHDSEGARELAEDMFADERRKAIDAFRLSQTMLEGAGLLTFDDFIVFAHRHLLVEENRRRWAAKWSHLIQDEGQDSNAAQCEIAKLLARDHENYMIVGDVAQCLYSFRGAKPEYLSDFAADWSARRIAMNRNYRSGRRIVALANEVIRPATLRMEEEMIAERDIDGDVTFSVCEDLDDEGENVASWIVDRVADGTKYSEVAVLFRVNAQSRAPEEALLRAKIPYVILGGCSFYERKEVKNLLGYLRVATRRDRDGDALRRCINAPFRFLGKAFVERMMAATESARCAELEIDWAETATNVAAQTGVQGRQRSSVSNWVDLIGEVSDMVADGENPSKILIHVVQRTDYVTAVENEDGEESIESSTGANVREMVRVAEKFSSAAELLEYIDKTITASRKQSKSNAGDRVTLMSCHRAKGLEYKRVWLVGANEGTLPHARGDVEEERRIAYVAVTRARDELVVSAVRRFATREGTRPGFPSSFFLDGLGAAFNGEVRT